MVWYGLSYFTSGLSESVVSFFHVNIVYFFFAFLENQRNLPYYLLKFFKRPEWNLLQFKSKQGKVYMAVSLVAKSLGYGVRQDCINSVLKQF